VLPSEFKNGKRGRGRPRPAGALAAPPAPSKRGQFGGLQAKGQREGTSGPWPPIANQNSVFPVARPFSRRPVRSHGARLARGMLVTTNLARTKRGSKHSVRAGRRENPPRNNRETENWTEQIVLTTRKYFSTIALLLAERRPTGRTEELQEVGWHEQQAARQPCNQAQWGSRGTSLLSCDDQPRTGASQRPREQSSGVTREASMAALTKELSPRPHGQRRKLKSHQTFRRHLVPRGHSNSLLRIGKTSAVGVSARPQFPIPELRVTPPHREW